MKTGAIWSKQGGIYAGIITEGNSESAYKLIISEIQHDIKSSTFNDGMDFAYKLSLNGFEDWHLLSIQEFRIARRNLTKDQFNKERYWTSSEDTNNRYWANYYNVNENSFFDSHKNKNYALKFARLVKIY